jgi:hypothetical protein
MKNLTLLILGCLGISSFFMLSCVNKEAIIRNLSHKWILETGFRNDKETASLSGLYFHFDDSGEVITNLNGQDERLTYSLIGEDIIEMLGSAEIFMNIVELSDSSLILQTNLEGYTFKFKMAKAQ